MTITQDGAPPDAAEAAAPEPFLTGSFNLFKTPDGGFVVAWKRKGDETTRHLPIPAALLMMAAAQTGRSIEELLAELLGTAP